MKFVKGEPVQYLGESGEFYDGWNDKFVYLNEFDMGRVFEVIGKLVVVEFGGSKISLPFDALLKMIENN